MTTHLLCSFDSAITKHVPLVTPRQYARETLRLRAAEIFHLLHPRLETKTGVAIRVLEDVGTVARAAEMASGFLVGPPLLLTWAATKATMAPWPGSFHATYGGRVCVCFLGRCRRKEVYRL